MSKEIIMIVYSFSGILIIHVKMRAFPQTEKVEFIKDNDSFLGNIPVV